MKTILYLLAVTCVSLSAHALQMCLDPGAPISAGSGNIIISAVPIEGSGAEWARINCILGPWSAPDDTSLHGGHAGTWFQTYDAIVNDFTSHNVQVYMLIGAEAVHSSTNNLNTDEWVADYTNNFHKIVGHFKDRVRVYESFNEPNDWAGGTSAQVTPYYFAKMLEGIYQAVKLDHWGVPDWQVTLVSGPLFSHDNDTVASYLNNVYSYGINNLNWHSIHTTYGTYPLDGLGYHIYVAQGPSSVSTVQNKMNGNLDAIWSTFSSYEGTPTDKRVWVSECGWTTAHVSTNEQARNVHVSFNLMRDDGRVTFGSWFCLNDFPGGHYGLYDGNPSDPNSRKPSWYAYYAQTISNGAAAVADDAIVVSCSVTGSAVTGELAAVTITMRNTGTQTWEGAGAANPYRWAALGDNELRWTNFAAGGVSSSVTSQHAYCAGTIAPAQEVIFSYDVAVPMSTGLFLLSGQMEHAGAGLFGDALQRHIRVTDTPPRPPSTNYYYASTNTALPFQPRHDDLLQGSGVTATVLDGGMYSPELGQVAWLTNSASFGDFGVGCDDFGAAVLADYNMPESRPSLSIQYDFPHSMLVTAVHVFGGWFGGREFLLYDLDVSYPGSDTFAPLIRAVTGIPGTYGSGATPVDTGTGHLFLVSRIYEPEEGIGGGQIDGVKFDFYKVANPGCSFFVDPFDGLNPEAVMGSVVREIDVLGVVPEPAGLFFLASSVTLCRAGRLILCRHGFGVHCLSG